MNSIPFYCVYQAIEKNNTSSPHIFIRRTKFQVKFFTLIESYFNTNPLIILPASVR